MLDISHFHIMSFNYLVEYFETTNPLQTNYIGHSTPSSKCLTDEKLKITRTRQAVFTKELAGTKELILIFIELTCE